MRARRPVAGAWTTWRGGPAAATTGWADAGVTAAAAAGPAQRPAPTGRRGYADGQLVQHDSYGVGTVTDVSGYGATAEGQDPLRRGGEKTFVADKVKLKVVTKK